jgi:tetratricopeptide (TPR) repeat protein
LRIFDDRGSLFEIRNVIMLHSFIVIILSFLLLSCGNYISVKVIRPAEIPTTQYKKVVIGTVVNNDKEYYLDKKYIQNFHSILSEELQKKNYFQVIHSKNDIPSSDDIIIISAYLQKSEYDEESIVGEVVSENNGYPHRDNRRLGKHLLNVHYKVNSINGELIGKKIIKSEDETTISDFEFIHPTINAEVVILRNFQRSIQTFLRAIIPYEERVSVEFMDDKSMPELKKGIEAAENGFWDLAISNFSKATTQSNNPLVHYAHYNLGIAYMYSYDFPNARISLRKALELNGSESVYKRAFQVLDRMERVEIKLKEQQK